MTPVELRTARLVLSAPTLDDVDAITRYCQDPLFETFLTTPWPYRREDAIGFVALVERWWELDSEYAFGIRGADGALMGVVSWRTRGDVGFWLGADRRGGGYMTEALGGLADWVLGEVGAERLEWEAFPGNIASARVARAAGFRYTGIRPVQVPARDGSRPDGWHGELLADDDRRPKDGWPL